jgi:hypothetical protein
VKRPRHSLSCRFNKFSLMFKPFNGLICKHNIFANIYNIFLFNQYFMWVGNIKWILRDRIGWDGMVCTGSNWLRIGTSGGLL